MQDACRTSKNFLADTAEGVGHVQQGHTAVQGRGHVA